MFQAETFIINRASLNFKQPFRTKTSPYIFHMSQQLRADSARYMMTIIFPTTQLKTLNSTISKDIIFYLHSDNAESFTNIFLHKCQKLKMFARPIRAQLSKHANARV